jgi:Sec-independent protein translocase protein TatA
VLRNPSVDGIVILIIVLVILDPKRLTGLGEGLGQGMRQFKDVITGESEQELDRPALVETSPMPTPLSKPTEPADTLVRSTPRQGTPSLARRLGCRESTPCGSGGCGHAIAGQKAASLSSGSHRETDRGALGAGSDSPLNPREPERRRALNSPFGGR